MRLQHILTCLSMGPRIRLRRRMLLSILVPILGQLYSWMFVYPADSLEI